MPGQPNIEYEGPVGYEKKTHKTHFSGIEKPLKSNGSSIYEWVEKRPGTWVLVKKVINDDIIHAVT
jgi:hypothetical protein